MNILKNYAFITIVYIIFTAELCLASDNDPARLFISGNEEYEAGNYAAAISDYEKARSTGKASAELYYNLAGAYFKSGNIGRSVLNYERAISLAPRDPDILSNYGFAKSMVTGKEPSPRGILSWRFLRIFLRSFTLNEMAMMASAVFFVFFIALGAGMVFEGQRAKALAASGFTALIIVFIVTAVFIKSQYLKSYAVTVAPSSDALFGPFDSATKFFTLHEGNGVIILETKGPWHRVRRPDGMVGWVKSVDVERI